MENEIRKLKRRKAAYKAAGLNDKELATNIRLRRMNEKYREFSEAAGLPEQSERLKAYVPSGSALEQVQVDVRIPKAYDGNFDDFTELSITKQEKAALLNLHQLSRDSGFEYGAVMYGDECGEPFTSKLPDKTFIDHNSLKCGAKLLHSHTNVTPLSAADMSHLLDKKVASIYNIGYNKDAFCATVGDGIRPTIDEYDDVVSKIAVEVNIDIMELPDAYDWGPPERNYVAIREQMYRIARYFGWTIYGGRISE